MPVATDLLTDDAAVIALGGQVGVDLRTDDADEASLLLRAEQFGSGQVYFYAQNRYSSLTGLQWPHDVATALACKWLCVRRFNEVPPSIMDMCDVFQRMLDLILAGKAQIPGGVRIRRPITVTNPVVDNRRFNDQVRVDTTKSTGLAQGYVRPIDPNAPDDR